MTSVWAVTEAPHLLVLIGILVLAAWIDVRQHRVPNALVLAGICFAILYQGLHPAAADNSGWLVASAGCLVGFLSLCPLYIVGATGAGDVKLMAMVGAFVGPLGALACALLTFAAGGILAISVLIWRRRLRRALCNVYHLTMTNVFSASAGCMDFTISGADSTGKLPYAVAIAAGTLTYLVAHAARLIH